MGDEELREQSLADLAQRLMTQTQTLVRGEIRLAQLELQEKGKRAGIGAGLFGGAGVVSLFGFGALVACLILLLATAMEAWVAALIVGAAVLVVAGVLALVGRSQVQRATPPAPEAALDSTRRDVELIKERASR
jgi:uncharacterized membrane protein YqjE